MRRFVKWYARWDSATGITPRTPVTVLAGVIMIVFLVSTSKAIQHFLFPTTSLFEALCLAVIGVLAAILAFLGTWVLGAFTMLPVIAILERIFDSTEDDG